MRTDNPQRPARRKLASWSWGCKGPCKEIAGFAFEKLLSSRRGQAAHLAPGEVERTDLWRRCIRGVCCADQEMRAHCRVK